MMIVLINGTYGVGKTTIANELKKRLCKNNLQIIDIDEIYDDLYIKNPDGVFLYGAKAYPQIDEKSLEVLKQYIKQSKGEIIILPMCITEEKGFKLIKDLSEEYKVIQFILTADRSTIEKRIMNDIGRKDPGFALKDIEKNQIILENQFKNAIKISTDNMKTFDICNEIINYIEQEMK